MLTIFEHAISLLGALAGLLAIVYYVRTNTQDRRGAKNSKPPLSEGTFAPKKPSIERSETNSTVSITVPASPHRPVAWSVEPGSSGKRSRVLTVLYDESDDSLESAIQKLDGFDSTHKHPPITSVDDPEWNAYVRNQGRMRFID